MITLPPISNLKIYRDSNPRSRKFRPNAFPLHHRGNYNLREAIYSYASVTILIIIIIIYHFYQLFDRFYLFLFYIFITQKRKFADFGRLKLARKFLKLCTIPGKIQLKVTIQTLSPLTSHQAREQQICLSFSINCLPFSIDLEGAVQF